jgi:ATP synthase protein I
MPHFLTGYDPASMVRAALGAAKRLDFLRFASVESMADRTRSQGGHGVEPSDEAALSARLRQLGRGLDQAGAGRQAGDGAQVRAAADRSALARGLRLSAELVGGVIVGAGLGLGLDHLFGTSPFGFIVCLLLGFAGGVLSVMRSAGVIPERKL